MTITRLTSYKERLATFTFSSISIPWPHTPPTPQPKDLAAAGFKHTPTKGDPDNVEYIECKLKLSGWEPHDNAFTEHVSRSPKCQSPYSSLLQSLKPPSQIATNVIRKTPKEKEVLTSKDIQKEKPTPKDIGFFDPSLQYDFPELRLYHDVNIFVDQVPCDDQYQEADIVQLLPKCLRGAAYMWYQSNHALKDANLAKCMKVLIAKFKKESSIQLSSKSAATQEAPHATPQLPLEYHKCTICSASFSSMNRLLSHSQMATCGKSSCNHCEEIFDSKNKLHDHIRSHECQKLLATKSISPHKSSLSALAPVETTFNDADTAIMKAGIEYSTHTTPASAAKSLTPHKSSLSALAPVESSLPSATPPPTYRAISPPPPTYEPYKKPYLTVADLYMRYAPLSRPPSSKATRTMTVLPTMSMQDLYEKFHDKEKRVIPTPSGTLDSPTKQHATRQNLGHVVFERFGFIRCPRSMPKSIAQGLTVQQQRHIKPIKHDALPEIWMDDVRRHTMSPVDLAVAVKTSAQH
ncbi:MAG: Baculoviral IAP repeat-containing protein 5, partial [Alectoria fallacina]